LRAEIRKEQRGCDLSPYQTYTVGSSGINGIKENAVITTSKQIEILATVEKVWDIQTNIDAWHEWSWL